MEPIPRIIHRLKLGLGGAQKKIEKKEVVARNGGMNVEQMKVRVTYQVPHNSVSKMLLLAVKMKARMVM